MVHKDESQVKDANVPSEHAGVKLLAAYIVAQFAIHDAEFAIPIAQLPQLPSAGALVTESVAPGGLQVKRANVTTEPAAVELLPPSPAAQSTVHDAELANLVKPLPQMLPVSASVTYGMMHRIGSHVNMPTYRASRLRMSCWYLAVHCTMQETVAGNLRCTEVTSLPPLPSICAKDTDGMVYSRARKRKAPTSLTSMPRWS